MIKLAVVLVSLLIGSASANTDYNREYARYTAWNTTCEIAPYSCVGVPVAEVIYEKMRPGLLGYYDGDESIHINSTLTNKMEIQEVLVHEMIHYLQKQVGGLVVPGPAEPICHAENEAFGLVDKWLISIGRDDMVVGDDWWVPYVHCWPYYDPKFEPYSWFKAMVEEIFFPRH